MSTDTEIREDTEIKEDQKAPIVPAEAPEELKDTEPEKEAEGVPEEASVEPEEPTTEDGDSPEPEDNDQPSTDSFGAERDSAANSDLMSIEKKEAEGESDEKDAFPSFFVEAGEEDEREKARVEVDILTSKKTGKVLTVARTGLGIDFKDFEYLRHTRVWFEFTVPTYDEISRYRKECGVWQPQAQQVLIDKLQMRDYLLVWHLKDWSLEGKDGKVELEHDKEDGSLEKKTIKKVYSLHPTIIDVVMTIFEKDTLLT